MTGMTTVPDRSRIRLPGISSRAYEHPADRSALVALRKLTGFDLILKNLAGLFNDRSLRLMFLASSVRTSPEQFPNLHHAMLDGCYILDLPKVPELFIWQNPAVNAMTLGTDKPFIVITTGMVDLFDEEEIRFIIGHELGHVLSGHSVYRTMLFHLMNLAAAARARAVRLDRAEGRDLGPGGVVPQVGAVVRPRGPAGQPGCRGRPAGADEDRRRRAAGRAEPRRVPPAGARVRRRAGRPRRPAQAAATAGHDAPVRRGPVRRAGPVGRRRRVPRRSWPGTTRAARTTPRPRWATSSAPRRSRTRNPGIAARTR